MWWLLSGSWGLFQWGGIGQLRAAKKFSCHNHTINCIRCLNPLGHKLTLTQFTTSVAFLCWTYRWKHKSQCCWVVGFFWFFFWRESSCLNTNSLCLGSLRSHKRGFKQGKAEMRLLTSMFIFASCGTANNQLGRSLPGWETCFHTSSFCHSHRTRELSQFSYMVGVNISNPIWGLQRWRFLWFFLGKFRPVDWYATTRRKTSKQTLTSQVNIFVTLLRKDVKGCIQPNLLLGLFNYQYHVVPHVDNEDLPYYWICPLLKVGLLSSLATSKMLFCGFYFLF